MIWIPFWAAGVVNGLAHCWGYRNFNSPTPAPTSSRSGILIGGEELHNNHHTYATSAKLSNKWYEFDIGWMYIRIMSAFKLAKVKKIAPTPRLSTGKPVLDHDTLQAVLSNRYEVMARYGKALKRAYRQELAKLKEVGAREKYQLMRGARKWFHKEEAGLDEPQTQAVAGTLLRQPEAAHVHRIAQGLVGHVGPLECVARTTARAIAGLVPSRGTKRHQGAAGFCDAPASLRLTARRTHVSDIR